jgi:phage terminase small subunit
MGALETYVAQVATVRQCEAVIKAEGAMVKGPRGTRPHPCIGAKNRASALVLQLARRLQLLPDAEAPAPVASNDPYAALGID